MAFIIKWRNRTTKQISPVITGLSKFPTTDAAEKQVSIWKSLWPYNEYYIEPIARDEAGREWWPVDDNHCHICGNPSH